MCASASHLERPVLKGSSQKKMVWDCSSLAQVLAAIVASKGGARVQNPRLRHHPPWLRHPPLGRDHLPMACDRRLLSWPNSGVHNSMFKLCFIFGTQPAASSIILEETFSCVERYMATDDP